jgi:hypothetical protein
MPDRNTLRIRGLLPPLGNLAKVIERDDAVAGADSIISLRRCELGICHRCASDRLTKIYDPLDSDDRMRVLGLSEHDAELLDKLNHEMERRARRTYV